jgi:hypothetical protein
MTLRSGTAFGQDHCMYSSAKSGRETVTYFADHSRDERPRITAAARNLEIFSMKPMFCLVTAIGLCLVNAAFADDDDYPSWRPNNSSATDITGPIIVQPNRFHAGNADFPVRLDSTVAAFKSGQGSIPAHIYEVTSAANPTLLNGKKLCGDTPPTWIVVVPQPPMGLELDAFTGAEKPASAASPGLCNTFAYIR